MCSHTHTHTHTHTHARVHIYLQSIYTSIGTHTRRARQSIYILSRLQGLHVGVCFYIYLGVYAYIYRPVLQHAVLRHRRSKQPSLNKFDFTPARDQPSAYTYIDDIYTIYTFMLCRLSYIFNTRNIGI